MYKARGRSHALRLGMLFCASEGLTEVQPSHQIAGIHAWNYSLEVARRLLYKRPPAKPNALQTIWEALESGPKTGTELHKVFGNNRTGSEINSLLEQMVRSGEVEPVPGIKSKAAVHYRRRLTNNEFNELKAAS